MKLFCLPYAGGSASIFAKWGPFIHPGVKLCPIELSGRGRRINESHYTSFDELVTDVLLLIKDEIGRGKKYSFFGHSMGAAIVFEVVQCLYRSGFPGPEHVFFSGRGAPYILAKEDKEYHKLSDTDFIAEIFKIGGTPKELFFAFTEKRF